MWWLLGCVTLHFPPPTDVMLVIAQARLLSDVIVDVTADGLGWADVRNGVLAIAMVFAARAVVSWISEVAAVRASARATNHLGNL